MSTMKKLGIWLLVILLIVAIGGYFFTRGDTASIPIDEVTGTDPQLDEPDAELFPTVKIAEPVGWAAGEVPEAATGITVSRFAEGLEHPRTIYTLPNGDVLVSLTRAPASDEDGGIRGWIAGLLMGKAGATGTSLDQVVLLRDTDGDGVADIRQVIAHGLASPSGLAWQDGTLYVANHDAVLAFPYALGANRVGGPARKITDLAGGGGHWMRNLELSPDGASLFVAVGSDTNIGDNGLDAEAGRALIWEIDLETGTRRQFAGGLRNPNGLDFSPWSGELWTTVNERDMLGSDLVPDYLTNVPLGAQYGWPWVYWGDNYDRRVEYPIPDYISYVRTPEYALGPHVAALGFVFTREGARMGERFGNGAFVARHGSWNRKPPSGYDVVYVAFDERGNPTGRPVPVLSGFLTGDGTTRGRPTWVDWARDGALLVSDDTAGIIWRAIAPGAQPTAAIVRNSGNRLPPRRELRGQEAAFGEDDYAREVTAP
ncbi:sorbosone dehydrogenase family protein [Erythrobacter litoralis]|uniref:PQQ-dependent sugar dehydrogenase n=1 Tax=Erythrobacter litoralis TaxID=39960 RepID=UPI0024349482|nr:sorbosone dehydrogenase family protein [Erythrobacter litoralis]MDG6079401.1 sorbosone dehydrogenase family protein [Erythrobacter litoralis]